jgi:hydrogenase nickel incorporation protein HypB
MADEKEEKFDRVMELESRKLAKEVDREFVIETQKQVEKNNDLIAVRINDRLKERGIKSFDFVGAIGAGKTALIERLSEKFGPDHKILVICGDIATRVDADRIQKEFVKAIQINTGRECALNAYHVDKVLKNVNIDEFDVVFVENVGNLVCPAEFKVGEDFKVMVLSVSEGDDKPLKYPLMFHESIALLINKIDLLPYVNCDVGKIKEESRNINPDIDIFEMSGKTTEGLDAWFEWLKKKIDDKK